MQVIRLQNWNSHLYSTGEQHAVTTASDVKEKGRKVHEGVVQIRSCRANRDIRKGGYLRSRGSMSEARSLRKTKGEIREEAHPEYMLRLTK